MPWRRASLPIALDVLVLLVTLVGGAQCTSKSPHAGDAGCPDANCASDADGSSAVSCNGQDAVCPGHPYAVCVEVQDGLGRCLDWTLVGATPCSAGPQDCPTALPSATFPGAPAGSAAAAVCVKAADVQFSAVGQVSPGYCAAMQAYSDPTGAATCTPNPCGSTGYCSFLHPTAGGSVVSCMWPI